MDRVTLKNLAKSQIKGNVGILFVITLLMGVMGGVAGLIPGVGSLAWSLIGPSFSLAIYCIYLNLTKGQKAQIGDLFSKIGQFWSAFKVTFLVGLFTALWTMLFVIPGIIKALSYSQAMYILAENPEIGALEAINRSKAMMEGRKMDLFVLELSFFGWFLLCGITFGIAAIWVVPYMSATVTNFYNSIKPAAEVEAQPVE